MQRIPFRIYLTLKSPRWLKRDKELLKKLSLHRVQTPINAGHDQNGIYNNHELMIARHCVNLYDRQTFLKKWWTLNLLDFSTDRPLIEIYHYC